MVLLLANWEINKVLAPNQIPNCHFIHHHFVYYLHNSGRDTGKFLSEEAHIWGQEETYMTEQSNWNVMLDLYTLSWN